MRAKAVVRAVLTGLVLAAAAASWAFDRPIKITHAQEKEMKYYDTKFSRGVRAIFYNLRDGSLGLIQNVWQLGAGTTAGVLLPTGKTLVLAGDVVGMFDDNLLTRPFLRGIFSGIFEELSYVPFRGAKGLMLMTHEMDDIPIVTDRQEFITHATPFKARLYLRPWAVIVLPATAIGDGVIRPVASIAKTFSIRRFTDMEIADIPSQLDEFGLRLIWKAYNHRFFLPIPEEEEPDLRIYTEEEVVGLKLPAPAKTAPSLPAPAPAAEPAPAPAPEPAKTTPAAPAK